MEENNKKEYLSEEQYQKTNKKVKLAATLLLIIGGISFLTCSVLIFGDFLDFDTTGLIGFLWVFSFGLAGAGFMLFMVSHSREINAYMAQQQMPVAKEGIEKMAPTAGKVAKEVTKGIKEGLEDEEE